MGIDVIKGCIYLLRIDPSKVHEKHIRKITKHFNINYNCKFDAFVIAGKPSVQRYNDIKAQQPVNWVFTEYLHKTELFVNNIIENKINDILAYEFKNENENENEWDRTVKMKDIFLDHGWYDVAYLSW